MGEEVHQRTDGHVSLAAIKLEVLVCLHRGVVSVLGHIRVLALGRQLLESYCIGIGERSILIEEAIVLPELVQGSQGELTRASVVNSVFGPWLLLHALLILEGASQEFLHPAESEVHPFVSNDAFKGNRCVLIASYCV